MSSSHFPAAAARYTVHVLEVSLYHGVQEVAEAREGAVGGGGDV